MQSRDLRTDFAFSFVSPKKWTQTAEAGVDTDGNYAFNMELAGPLGNMPDPVLWNFVILESIIQTAQSDGTQCRGSWLETNGLGLTQRRVMVRLQAYSS